MNVLTIIHLIYVIFWLAYNFQHVIFFVKKNKCFAHTSDKNDNNLLKNKVPIHISRTRMDLPPFKSFNVKVR